MPKQSPEEPMEWRVDVKGYPVTVLGKHAMEHLQKANMELARMKMALHRILHMNPQEWGKQGIYKAQNIAREGLIEGAYIHDKRPTNGQ